MDNVFLADLACDPTPGGLVTGTVDDADTGAGIDAATVSGDPNLAAVLDIGNDTPYQVPAVDATLTVQYTPAERGL